jgi:hypothetical protein
MDLTSEQGNQLRASAEEHRALQVNYARLANAAWAVVRHTPGHERETGSTLDDEITFLGVILRHLSVQCRCDPPGSGEEYCTGHCALPPGGR